MFILFISFRVFQLLLLIFINISEEVIELTSQSLRVLKYNLLLSCKTDFFFNLCIFWRWSYLVFSACRYFAVS